MQHTVDATHAIDHHNSHNFATLCDCVVRAMQHCDSLTVFCFCFLQADAPEGSAATVIGLCGDVSNADDMDDVRDRVEVMC